MGLFDFNFYSGDIHGDKGSSIIEFVKIIGGALFGITITKGYEWLDETGDIALLISPDKKW